MNKKEIQNKKEIDEIENQIVEIITSSNEADKEIKKEGLADHKYIRRIADDCRKLDQILIAQVTLSKHEVSKIFEEYLKHEKISDSAKSALKACMERYFVPGMIGSSSFTNFLKGNK